MEQHSKRYGKSYPDQPLPMIYSTVYYNGRTSYPYSVSFLDLINDPLKLAPNLLEQTFQLVDIGQVDDEAIQARQWSSLMEFFMKHIYARDLLPHVQRLMPKMYEVESQGGREYLKAILTYILTAGEVQDKGTLFKTVRTHLSDKTGDDVMTIAEQLRCEGKQEGLMEGVQRGKQEGKLEGKQEGLMEGSQQGKRQMQQVIALKLLHQGENIQKISHLTDLTEEEVISLQKAHTH